MSTPFKSEWLQPGAIVPVDIPTLAAFGEELRRVNQENQALRQALETEQEPVGWLDAEMSQAYTVDELPDASGTGFLPLYTAPPKQWVGLTAYEIQEIHSGNQHWGNFACAIEAKLKEKNHG